MSLLAHAATLRDTVDRLSFGPPVACTYNPLRYAWAPHAAYLERYGGGSKRIVFLGMNPGPFGMTQTGVPFGEILAVRDWLRIHEPVTRPALEHPKRPITGFGCTRSEVSGRRLWGWFAARFSTPEAFFADHFVLNYCPLVWMAASGANLTPDKLSVAEREAVEVPCRAHLRAVLDTLRPDHLVGVGGYAAKKFAEVTTPLDRWTITQILHPSPASPAANKGWPAEPTRTLETAGIWR
ncbi:MAG: single-stranded DNA-binding protein [Verrucomicrobia bacterium]|nr:MAG: single-stranded DNA-binding protein [Verrucomicrobiota bacterium]